MVLKIADYIQSEAHETKIGRASVEHIFPKNPAPSQWGGPDNQAKMEPYLWNIGNLTMLGVKLNSTKARNDEYAVKRQIYLTDTKVVMTKNLATYYATWDENVILERAKHVTKKALEIWNFNNVSHV